MKEVCYDVIILGSGPAGLTAAIYNSRANLKVLLLAGENWGGQLMLTTEVENFPGFPEGIMGPELMANMRKQAERFGVEFVLDSGVGVTREKSIFVVKTSLGNVYQGKSLIVATGADTKWLGVPGERELIGRGISSCAPCDGAFFKNRRVYVVGGGDSAMEEATVLSRFASEVTILHRRDSFRASKIMIDRVLALPNVSVFWESDIVQVQGKNKLESVIIRTGSRKFRENEKFLLERGRGTFISESEGFVNWESVIDGVFMAIGHTPNSLPFVELLPKNDKGYLLKAAQIINNRDYDIFIKKNIDYKSLISDYPTITVEPGIFLAGDVNDGKYMQAITAAAMGCQAALDAERWLESGE